LTESSLEVRTGNIVLATNGNLEASTVINKTIYNDNVNINNTGTFSLTAGGTVSLGDSEIFVDDASITTEVFSISSGGTLDLGSSTITVQERVGNANLLLETTGPNSDINLGASSITFDATSNGTITSTI